MSKFEFVGLAVPVTIQWRGFRARESEGTIYIPSQLVLQAAIPSNAIHPSIHSVVTMSSSPIINQRNEDEERPSFLEISSDEILSRWNAPLSGRPRNSRTDSDSVLEASYAKMMQQLQTFLHHAKRYECQWKQTKVIQQKVTFE